MPKLSGTWAVIANEIDAVFKRHNYTRKNFRVSRGLGGEFRLTISGQEAMASGEKPKPFAREAANYKAYYNILRMKLEWLDKPFSYGGKTYILRGYDGSKPKNCMVLERDGRSYKASDDQVRQAFEFGQLDEVGT